ncbi:hypothetical protein C9I98_09210 [Photobacterium sanctipauli]|uniref:Uncharacterized protein n=1 Tax=Photobacterium sanctipauli TaxID=1342794 RepID=A0A2T3NVB1_9GAMM|nr:hypothetical protein [Photobacterium sanctipauli]PSW20223.1 hypothetical protein C9I98_09210 [Photobacterium sanctipauli]
MKTLIAVLIIISSANCFSAEDISMLNTLKGKPATLYDIGKLKLEVAALEISRQKSGERVKGTKFTLDKVSTIESENTLGVKLSYSARSKYITDNSCKQLQLNNQSKFNPEVLAKDLWPMLDEKSLKGVSRNLTVATELVDEDNDQLTIVCY